MPDVVNTEVTGNKDENWSPGSFGLKIDFLMIVGDGEAHCEGRLVSMYYVGVLRFLKLDRQIDLSNTDLVSSKINRSLYRQDSTVSNSLRPCC